jgi:hypothetical protein
LTTAVLVDDHLLLRILLDDEPSTLRPPGAIIATTGLWYHRLCRALTGKAVVGSMSRRLGAVDQDLAAQAVAAVIDLPATIELLSLRTLGWPMGQLVSVRTRLNLLSLEALAAARHLEAEVCLAAADDNPPLQSAASALGIPVRTLTG